MFLGGSSEQVDDLVQTAVTQAGGVLATVVAVREPLDLSGIAQRGGGDALRASLTVPPCRSCRTVRRYWSAASSSAADRSVDRELASRVRASLLSAFDGQLTHLDRDSS